MSKIFELALSGFWSFIGTIMLLTLICVYGFDYYKITLNFILKITAQIVNRKKDEK